MRITINRKQKPVSFTPVPVNNQKDILAHKNGNVDTQTGKISTSSSFVENKDGKKQLIIRINVQPRNNINEVIHNNNKSSINDTNALDNNKEKNDSNDNNSLYNNKVKANISKSKSTIIINNNTNEKYIVTNNGKAVYTNNNSITNNIKSISSNNDKSKIHDNQKNTVSNNNESEKPQFLTPAYAKQKFKNKLTIYEQNEILKFREIYFLGNCQKSSSVQRNAPNFGFDLPTSHYKINLRDHIAYRYEIRGSLGRGNFGEVISCLDHKTNKEVAVKVLVNTPLMNKQGIVEIKIMKLIAESSEKENNPGLNCIATIIDSFTFRNHICIVTDIYGISLFDYLKLNNFNPMPEKILQNVAYEIIAGLELIHRKGIIHGDLKPENILFTNSAMRNIKIIDFGSSCTVGEITFNYIQSRFYRAPEVFFGLKYGTPIDMWSVGCIIAELASGHPIFRGDRGPGMISKISEIIGNPPQHLIEASPYKRQYITSPGKNQQGPITFRSKLSVVLKTNDQNLISFVSKCLEWDPTKRMTAKNALSHPWIARRNQK